MTFPAQFVKGDKTKTARNAADAVKFKFEGFKPQRDAVAPELEKPAEELSLVATGDDAAPKPPEPDSNALESAPAPAAPTELDEAPAPAKPAKQPKPGPKS